MSYRHLGIVFLAAALGAAILSTGSTTTACAPVMPRGTSVEIATETALIVWDEKAKKQHFIRRAAFETSVPYFGFLVPTPTPPELAEAPNEVFNQLEDWTKPEEKTETMYVKRHLVPLGCAVAALPNAKSAVPGGVEVLARVHGLGGYDAAVLRATDTQALQDWLAKHGYDARPAVMKWLDRYVKAGWIVTAFQIAKKEKEVQEVAPQAVRMSFTTDRPFFPYSEPEDQGNAALRQRRLLRVFFLGNQRMQGALDEQAVTWSGKTVWAGRLDEPKRQTLAASLAPQVGQPEGAWLTVFDDQASPRAGTTDVFFAPSADPSEVRRPPIIHYRYVEVYDTGEIVGLVICLGLLLSPVVILPLLWWVRRRRLETR